MNLQKLLQFPAIDARSTISKLILKARQSAIWRSPGLLIGLLLAGFVITGFLVGRDYGASWDEQLRISYAQHSLALYAGHASNLTDEKGPFFVMVAWLGAQVIKTVLSGYQFISAWHLMTFLTYTLGLFFFYRLCRRLVNPTPALVTTLLFGTQPLLWGHAFINPKDIPFMVLFAGAIVLGLEMVDAFNRQAACFGLQEPVGSWLGFRSQMIVEWQKAARRRAWLVGAGLVWLGLVAGHSAILAIIAWVVRAAYTASPGTLLRALFARFAQHAGQIPLDAYILKGQNGYTQLAIPALGLLLIFVLVLAGRVFPILAAHLLQGRLQPQVFLAAAFLGFATSTRVLGPAAGGMVALYFLMKSGRKAWPTLLAYLGVGIIATYITWPGLWNNPLANYLASFSSAVDFEWVGKITFAGKTYLPGSAPPYFMPALIGLQLTEPALFLIVGGLGVGLIWLVKKPQTRLDVLLLLTWFFLPMAAAVSLRLTQYDNFRHFLFIIPPLFILAALGLQSLAWRLKRTWVLILVALLLLAPGLYWDVVLHPYQYIYYNSLVGGPRGAFRSYEMDYWVTSYKEAAEHLNQVAWPGARMVVWGPDYVALTYTRPDLVVLKYSETEDPPAEYAILSTRDDADLKIYPDAPIIYRVERAGATLAVVKQLSTP